MSWDVDLIDPETEEPVRLPTKHSEGGTHVLGGATSAELNVTYNYSRLFSAVSPSTVSDVDGRRVWLCFQEWLNGKDAGSTITELQDAVNILGTTQDSDYWRVTAGNAGYALNILLSWARMYPEAIWSVV